MQTGALLEDRIGQGAVSNVFGIINNTRMII